MENGRHGCARLVPDSAGRAVAAARQQQAVKLVPLIHHTSVSCCARSRKKHDKNKNSAPLGRISLLSLSLSLSLSFDQGSALAWQQVVAVPRPANAFFADVGVSHATTYA